MEYFTDGDGLKDGEEMKQKYKYIASSSSGIPEEYLQGTAGIYFNMTSNPNKEDTDGDGLIDVLDNSPCNSKIHEFIIYETEQSDENLVGFTIEERPQDYGCNNNYIMTDNELSEIKSKEIVKCFDNKDIETLKNMFCKKTQSEHELDNEIQIAFDFYEGKSISYENNCAGPSGQRKYGECIEKRIKPDIRDIKTDTGAIFNLYRAEFLVNKNDIDTVGIVVLSLYDSNGKLLATIGGWEGII